MPPQDHPDTFGEARYPLSHLGLLSCGAAIAPIAINFAVSLAPQEIGKDQFIAVYVTRIDLMEKP